MAKFKQRHEYNQAEAERAQQARPPVKPVALEDDLLQWAIRTFFDTLFKRATDTITDDQVTETFKIVVEQMEHLSADDRIELIRDMDFFVGRIKSNIEPVLVLWYRALNK